VTISCSSGARVRHQGDVPVSLHPALGLVALAVRRDDRAPPAAIAQVAPDVLDGCRRGDRAALESVFRAHAEGLSRLLVRIVGPVADVQDLLQDTFANAIVSFPTFRGEASVKTWLYRVAIHVAHQHLRRPRHRREVELPDADALAHADAAAPEQRELSERLYAHLDALDPAKRIALVLYVIEGHTVDEIAALTRTSKAAARSRIFWARRALLKRLRRDPAFGGGP
jgi:RNA polymerase sigma-70 factor (ECF subfamily)